VLAQAVINVGGVVDALPVTGIPLPFISYGGSSLVVVLLAAGLLFGIARRQPATAPA
jgi:cell division protein FtsW